MTPGFILSLNRLCLNIVCQIRAGHWVWGHGKEGVWWEGQEEQGIIKYWGLEQGRTWALCVLTESKRGLIFALEDQNSEHANINMFQEISRFWIQKNCENWLYVYLIYIFFLKGRKEVIKNEKIFYKNCINFNLKGNRHILHHSFLKIRTLVPPVKEKLTNFA